MLIFTPVNIHEVYMGRCLSLAEKGLGHVSPNPLVGAVLVYDDKIIGEGYHQTFGKAHAEVNCINSVENENLHLVKDSILYVSLEPCNHYGKTPPCTDLILQHQIKKVVVGCRDVHSIVNGTGIQKLINAGVDVIEGVLQKEAINTNRRFFTFHNQKRPYIILKWAQSNNKKISGSDKSRVKISNEITDRLVHKWRSEEDAIMVGTNTVIFDNPELTTRLFPGKNPLRIFIDKKLRVDKSSNILNDASLTLIFNCLKETTDETNSYLIFDENKNFIQQLNQILYKKNVQSVLIEGGANLLNSFIQEDAWDEARIITNEQLLISQGTDAPNFIKNKFVKSEVMNNDRIDYFIKKEFNPND